MTEIESSEQRTIYNIPAINLEKFKAECAKLSRKAEKMGCERIKPVIFGYHLEKMKDGNEHQVYEVLFTCEVPKIEGWSFLGTIDHSNETGNIIRTVPNLGIDIPESYRTSQPICEHCKVNRYRRDTYLLRCDETAEMKQVGKTCLEKFFGIDPYKIAKMAELLGYAAECARGYREPQGFDRRMISVPVFAAYVAATIRNHGWVSRKIGEETGKETTSIRAQRAYFHGDLDGLAIACSDEDRKVAMEALEWAEGLIEKDSKSEYEHHISIIAAASFVEPRSLGLLASLVGVFEMNRARETRKPRATAQSSSQHIGQTGGRIEDIEVVAVSYTPSEGRYGPVHRYGFETPAGDRITWFASKGQKLQKGERLFLSGTVQKHEVFQNIKSTTMSRCTVKRAAAKEAA